MPADPADIVVIFEKSEPPVEGPTTTLHIP